MHIYLIRHGESTGDLEDRYGGDYDDHLTERGRSQAQALAESLVGKGIEALFVSPLHRASETGEIVAAQIGLKPITLADLRERNSYGRVTGLVKSEAQKNFPEIVVSLADPTATVEGAEPYDQFIIRVAKTMTELASQPYQIIAILTHGGFIRGFYRSVLDQGELAQVGDCTVIELGHQKGTWVTQ